MEYNALLEKVQSIIIGKGYNIIPNQMGEGYAFYIYDKDVLTSNITIYKSTGNIIIGKTRTRQELEDQNTFHITWITTENEYRGKGLALLLLIYSICYLKLSFPDVSYVTLDDDSDRSDKLEPNLYGSLGFVSQGQTEIDMTKRKRLILSGPEKQLLLNEDFIRLANAQLASRRGGRIKTRRYRMNKIYKSNKKNKKTKRRKSN